jgi:spore germination cell wall hydrolase CwlJ-like protein
MSGDDAMKTRREITAALLGFPLAAAAATQNVTTAEDASPVAGTETDLDVPPFSETAVRIISYTLYAEARGEPFEGMKAVASVIKTRAMRAKISLAEVCLQDRQFTCWNDLDAVPEFFITGEGINPKDMKARSQCFGIAWAVLVNNGPWDYLTHFYNPDKATPGWAFEMEDTRIIGNHVFGCID